MCSITHSSTSISTSENPIPSLSYVFNLYLSTLCFLTKNKEENQPISSPSISLFPPSFAQPNFSKWCPFSSHLWPHVLDDPPPALPWLLPHQCSKDRSSLKLNNVAKPQGRFQTAPFMSFQLWSLSQPHPTWPSPNSPHSNHTGFLRSSKSRFHTCCPSLN